MRRILTAIAAGLALVLVTAGVAVAAVGDDAGSASLSIHNVQAQDATFTGPSSRTVSVDCPAGESILTGFGSQVDNLGQISTIVPGAKVDADTWSVTFSLDPSRRYVLLVTATCLEV